ncbi:MAG: ABC transporter substrate-binding protein [Micrococcales bacterium]|nr:ABC transporter substrate-binding protein [Micrococcales bacterium]
MSRRRLTLTSLAAAVTVSMVGLAGCASSDEKSAEYTIGTAVIVSHPALQSVLDGFEDVLKEEGLDYRLINKNAQGDPTNAATIASTFASDANIDLVLAISTPIALAVANAEKDRPILFAAVTDPVRDDLVPSWDQAGTNITGTSDLNPEARPVSLVQEAMPDVQTIGVLYSSAESNSLAQVEAYEAEAAEIGVTLKTQAITSASEIAAGLEALADVDAILIPNDNTVVAAISSVIGFGQEKQIPVFCADTSTVELGTVATRGLSYYEMGRRTGEMAVSILRDGVKVDSIKPEATTSTELTINVDAAARFGLTLPESLVSQATVVDDKN